MCLQIHCAINSPHQFPYIVIDHHEIIADVKCIVMEDSIVQLKVMYINMYCLNTVIVVLVCTCVVYAP